jgi:hypothetical protein
MVDIGRLKRTEPAMMLPLTSPNAVGAHHQRVGREIAEAQEGRPVFGDDQRNGETERHHPRPVQDGVDDQDRAHAALLQHQPEACRERIPSAAPAARRTHGFFLLVDQPLTRRAQGQTRDDEAERRCRQEMDHRQEEVECRRHHGSNETGDTIGGVKQAVDGLLGVAVGHQGGDGRLQRRREHHAQRREADRGGDQ